MAQTDLLLNVWREACRHLELAESVKRIALLLADHVPADYLVVRQIDLTRGGLETVAVGPCHTAAESLALSRTECSSVAMRNLLAWCRDTTVTDGTVPGPNSLLTTVVPQDFRGACLAAPVHMDDGPTGVVLVLSNGGHFSAAHRTLLSRLIEPIGVALANTARVHELKRLREALEADKQVLLRKLGRHDVADAVVGAETGLRGVMDQVEQVAPTDLPVLIIGETGSGKEVLARSLHERSRRARAPMVRVNCGAIPSGLVDAELFGQERGTLAGRVTTKPGWFERADGGTLFLDEISELPLEAQVRLMRVLEEGTIERVGGTMALPVDVRIVAATHRDLREMVERQTFREDLWHVISVFPIQLPPLRERREDIPRLATHFAARAGMRLVGVPLTPTSEELELLLVYDWPGNVRELAAVIERAAILGRGRRLLLEAALGGIPSPHLAALSQRDAEATPPAENLLTLEEAMRHHIELALQEAGGRVEGPRGAALQLGINPHTLRARMRKLKVHSRKFRGAAPRAGHQSGLLRPLDVAMADHICQMLQLTSGRIEGQRGAAKRLAINPHTLRARMRKLGIVAAAYRARAGSSDAVG